MKIVLEIGEDLNKSSYYDRKILGDKCVNAIYKTKDLNNLFNILSHLSYNHVFLNSPLNKA